ncbi:GNAT family N-acetyltransferase [Bacillus sp. FJAT-27264]|uniref:GNAT family N-acetyltransferase n=1 Tax=Paenibacillus sp. (strain DSM 101736 / FJAT-27264) TaxID=1850362 RepID=UPI0008080ADB|nr:GNAT family N-acetyltransferase [Bacillus sp. FJAT-27264]OBZ18472.1 GNAT family N-acetyltransferase [Bacillus sp. FJAT-27264]
MIRKMTYSNISDYNNSNENFIVSGRVLPKYEHGNWSYTKEIFSETYLKQYENEEIDTSYIEDTGKAVFLYYDDNICVGRIKLYANWNGYALVEDIGVSKAWRHQGIGTKLLEKSKEWAKQNNLLGLMLETQDINVSACDFYARNNFIIGGVDCMLYSNFSTANEKAIFWYYKF